MQRGMLVAAVAVVLLWVGGLSYGDPPWSNAPSSGGPAIGGADGLISHHLPGGPTGDHLVVIDPVRRIMAVYRVHRERGEIELASVRQMQWDMQLDSYKGEGPLPAEIRAGLERQQF